MVKSYATNTYIGCAFIEFEDPTSIPGALQMHGVTLNGNALVVQPSPDYFQSTQMVSVQTKTNSNGSAVPVTDAYV